jgi:hypothetical protein
MPGHASCPFVRRVGVGALLVLGALSGCAGNHGVIYGGVVGVRGGAQQVTISGGVLEMTTPEAVPAEHRYRSSAPPDAIITYSLRAATLALSGTTRSHSGVLSSEAWQLGGINVILGAIIDSAGEDVIIVGRQEPDLPPLTLDELVTILRAKFVVNKAPFISIDPRQERALLNSGTTVVETIGTVQRDPTIPGFQSVRTEGAVADTQVGANMIDADFRMKLISLGLLRSGVEDVDTAARRLTLAGSVLLQLDASDRFEFYPDANGIYVDRLFVILAGGGRLAVRTERESGAWELAGAERAFAGALSAHTRELAARHASIGSVYVYSQLYALAVGLEEANAAAYVTPLLARHQPAQVHTVRKIPRIVTSPSLVIALTSRDAVLGPFVRAMAWLTQIPHNFRLLFQNGGVSLDGYSITSALRQRGLSLRTAILESRPARSAISWTYRAANADEMSITSVGELITMTDVSVELERLRRAVATGLTETVMALAERIFRITTQEAAIHEAARAVALTAILTGKEADGARMLSKTPSMMRSQYGIDNLIGLLEALAISRRDGSAAAATAVPADPDVSSRVIWALALRGMGQTERACALMPDLREEFANGLTVDLALECASQRHDTDAIGQYITLAEHGGLRMVAANYYRGEIERLAGRLSMAAAWYYSYLGEELNPEDSRVRSARAFLDTRSEAGKVQPFDVPAGYGVVVLIRYGQWAGTAHRRLVTSQLGDRIYGRLGPGEFLVIPLRPGSTVLRLLGSLVVNLRKELTVDVKAGEISVFDVRTAHISQATSVGVNSGLQAWLSCTQNVSSISPKASGGTLAGIALRCLAVGAVQGVIDGANRKIFERRDDFLIGPALDAKPVLGESWRQTIQSLRPAGPWGAASPL